MLVSVTRLQLRSVRFLLSFLRATRAIQRQMQSSDGFVAGTMNIEPLLAFWTMTVWRDEAAMRAFRNASTHLAAMPRLLDWCNEAAFAHWQQHDDRIPSPTLALERLDAGGHLSKVNYPSARHAAGGTTAARAPLRGLPIRPRR
jgi:hypothetical protein